MAASMFGVIGPRLYGLGIQIVVLGILACTLVIWVVVGQVASKIGGPVYVVLHVALVVLLTPICFVGLFAIPSLVLSDLRRQREQEEKQMSRKAGSAEPSG